MNKRWDLLREEMKGNYIMSYENQRGQKKRSKQQTRQKNVITNLVEINPTTSITTLNMNGLNRWIKNKDGQNGFKK